VPASMAAAIAASVAAIRSAVQYVVAIAAGMTTCRRVGQHQVTGRHRDASQLDRLVPGVLHRRPRAVVGTSATAYTANPAGAPR